MKLLHIRYTYINTMNWPTYKCSIYIMCNTKILCTYDIFIIYYANMGSQINMTMLDESDAIKMNYNNIMKCLI
jgi:hypothetical protein